MPNAASIRAHACFLEPVEQLATEIGIADCFAPTIIAELAIALSHYTEEAQVLFPDLFLTKNGPGLIRELQGSGIRSIWHGDNPDLRQLVKTCAPLAQNGLALVCAYSEADKYTFGIFRARGHPTAVPVEDMLIGVGDESLRSLLIQNAGSRSVQLLGSNGKRLVLDLRPTAIDMDNEVAQIRSFAEICTRRVETSQKEQVANCIRHALSVALRSDHGFLIAVLSTKESLSALFRDFAEPSPPLNFAELVQALKTSGAYHEFSEHHCNISLLASMLWTDGAVVFTEDGVAFAFNAFAKVPSPPPGAPQVRQSGGARRRAYQSLTGR